MINRKTGTVTKSTNIDLDVGKKARTIKNKQIFESPHFKKACENAGMEPTKRQASKYANKRGKAWLHR